MFLVAEEIGGLMKTCKKTACVFVCVHAGKSGSSDIACNKEKSLDTFNSP